MLGRETKGWRRPFAHSVFRAVPRPANSTDAVRNAEQDREIASRLAGARNLPRDPAASNTLRFHREQMFLPAERSRIFLPARQESCRLDRPTPSLFRQRSARGHRIRSMPPRQETLISARTEYKTNRSNPRAWPQHPAREQKREQVRKPRRRA